MQSKFASKESVDQMVTALTGANDAKADPNLRRGTINSAIRWITFACNDIRTLETEVVLLRQALAKYGDRARMATVEPIDLQQAIDRAFEASS